MICVQEIITIFVIENLTNNKKKLLLVLVHKSLLSYYSLVYNLHNDGKIKRCQYSAVCTCLTTWGKCVVIELLNVKLNEMFHFANQEEESVFILFSLKRK